MTFSDWSNANNSKKKKKSTDPKDYASFSEWSNAAHGVSTDDEEDIAPVKSTTDTVETTQEIYDKWGKYYNESDYDEYSKKGASIVNPTPKEAQGWLSIAGHRFGAEEVGNVVTFSRDHSAELALAELNGQTDKEWRSTYRYMTDFEVGIYNYLLAKNGKESAQEFLNDIEETLNVRQGSQMAEGIQKIDNSAAKAVMYGLTSVGSGVESAGTGLKQLFSEDALPVTSTEVTNQILLEGLDGYKKNLYQAGNTVGNMLPSVAVGFLNPTVGQIIQSSSAAGNAYRQSLVEGKTKEEAATFGVMVGGLEFVTSKLLGSVGTMTGNLPKKALSKIATLENGLLRVGAKYAINLASEITEEEFQLWLEPAARWIAFGEDYDAPSIEEMAETLIVTGISTGILNLSTDIATGNLTKVDGLSVHEAKVIDAVVNEQIVAKEAEGKKLTGKEKDAIREEVIDQMNKGQLGIDTIERTLGGKTYAEYKSLTEKENTLTEQKKGIENEIASLVKTPEAQFTVEQRERLTSLREEAKGIKDSIKALDTKGVKSRLSDEVFGIAKNTRLGETYAEKARRGQAFHADLTQYKDPKQRVAVERAIKSGVLNNTYRAHELVNTLAKIEADKGITFDYVNNAKLKESGFAIEGKTVNGYVKDGGVTLNVQSAKAWQTTVGHEITHVLEGTEAYSALRETLYAYAESKGELASRKAALTELYKDIKGADLDAELTADLVGDYLFTNKEFIDKLTGNRTLFQKVWDEVKYLCKVATGKELTEIEKVEREFARAWKEYGDALHIDNLFDDDSVNPFETDDSGEADLAYSVSVTDKNTLDSLNDQVAKGEYSVSKDIENFDNSWYNEIKLSAAEQERVQSEALTWNADKRNQLITQTLSNGVTYRYVIDDDGIAHIYEREEAVDIHEREKEYDNANREEPDSVIEELGLGQGNNGEHINVGKNGRYPGKDDANDNRFVSGKGRGNRTGRSKNRVNAYGKPKKIGWRFNEDGSVEITYSDGSKEIENTAPIKEVSSTDDAFFDGENKDVQFSLSKSVEETKELMALHNLQSSELVKTLELGGLPMPSIAVIKGQQGHDKYGDVSLIFPKNTIDPQANKDNKVYGGDAWTPTYPRVEYKASESVQNKVRNKYYELADKLGYDAVRPLYKYAHELESALNSEQGETNLLDWLYKDTKLMQVYLEDSGKGKVEDIVKETRTEASESDKQMSQWFVDKLGEDFIRAFKTPKGESPLSYRKNYIEEHKAEIASAWESYCRDVFQLTEEQVQNVMRDTNGAMYMKFMRNAEQYLNNGGVTIKTETDFDATDRAIEEKAADGYKEWIDSLFKGAEEKTGIRNDKDAYTSSGNRRNWDALHWENTLENVVKAMKAQDQTGADAHSPVSAIFAVAHKRYDSIDAVRADSNRLGRVSEDEYKAMEEGYASRLVQIAKTIQDPNEQNPFIASDRAAQEIIDAVRNYKTKAGMLRYMQKWNSRVTESTVDDILSLVSDIANMPTGYFEAKPQRAVGLEEVGVFVIPRTADVKLKQELLNRGYSIAEYDPDVEGDRQKVVNQFEQYKFSLSDVGEQPSTIGTPLNETALEDVAPVAPVAPAAEDANTTPSTTEDTPNAQAFPTEKPAIPKSERIADGSRSDELLYESLDNHPVQTIEQRVAEKIRALEGEIADKKDLRGERWDYFEGKIAGLRAKYNALKNKDTKEASNILQSISRYERSKASEDADFGKRISDLETRVEKMRDPSYHTAMVKRDKMEADAKFAADLLGDTSTWRDKKLGLQYATNTERRNLRDIVRGANGKADIAKADAIDDALNGQYNREQAEKNREQTKVQDKYAKLKITKAEDAYIQMLGELRYNPETTLTEQAVKEYYEKHSKKIDTAKVDKVIEMARADYDDLFNRVNDELRKQGMREIPYRKGYFPHFTEPKQNFIQKLLNWKTQDNEIPTSIAGLTETFKPTRSWQSFDKTRHSDETDYSFLKGFDSYLDGALDWIYHMDTLQKRRAVENHIRYTTHSDEGIQARIKEVYADEGIDANEAQAQIEAILAEANNPLNNFVQDFTTHTNILAGKKNSLDRTVEQWTNRKIYSVMQNVQNRTSANMVLANVRSALTNFIPITQSWAQVSPIRSLQAAKETIANSIKDDGTVEKSTFLTNRLREADKLYKTNWDKVLDKAGIMFEIVDNFSSQVIWRSKYNQNLANGMSEAEAIHNADQFAENVMAGRSKGNEPTLFNAKNPFVKAFTMFQLEVNNQYGYLFKDVPTDLKAETEHWKFNLAKGYTTAFIGAYVYNALLEKVTGSDAALDPIGVIEDLLKDLGLFGDDEEEEPTKTATNLLNNVVEELPFVGGIAGGGRIPISSAMPYGGEYGGGLSGFIEDVGNIGNGGLKNIGKEMMNPLLNVGLPVGGGQVKKTVQGLKMFSDEHPVSGSYTDSGSLRFPVEDTPLNRVQAALFGQYASKNAREYFDNDYAPLKEKQIQEYIDVDMPISDYWKYREGLAKQDKLEDKFDYINDLDLPIDKKNILVNNVVDRKEKVDLTNYDDFASLEEFDFAAKNPEKWDFLQANGVSYGEYTANEESREAYNWAYKNPDGYAFSKMISDDVVTYRRYASELYDIKADKDSSGKSISGSRKAKVIEYLNNLDADYYTKILLLKSEYPSEDGYNAEIIDYVNNRDDLTYKERVTILTELGFRVVNGQIYAD